MGKRIISQARGHGSFTYRVRRKAFRFKVKYPGRGVKGIGKVIKLLNSPGHSAPLAKIQTGSGVFYNVAGKGLYEGKEINIDEGKNTGDIIRLKDAGIGMQVFNIEIKPGDGGKIMRTAGSSAVVNKKIKAEVFVLMPNKKEVAFNKDCRATIGVVAGHGRLEKPVIKAGKKYYMMKARSKLWPRTSAVKVNAIDHPFGGGRGKRIKSKIAKRNAPPGKKVGTLLPRRTGRKKR